MKIAMLARNANLYSHKEARGHSLDIINTLQCYMNIASRRPEIYYNGEKLEGYDAVIPRIGASITFYGLAVLRQFEMMGVYPLNESVAIGRSRDKLRSMQLLARDGIGLPVTAFAHDAKKAGDIVELAGGTPVVIKLLEGTQGIGVVLADTDRSARSVIEAFRGANVNIMAQEFIKEAGGTDIRAIVVGGKVIAAMKRTGAAGDFRSNLHRGGSAQVIKISPEERATAVRAAKSMGLAVCGVDMLRANHGPVVMEVNSSPGLEGVEKATGLDIAGKIITHLEKHAKPNKTKTCRDRAPPAAGPKPEFPARHLAGGADCERLRVSQPLALFARPARPEPLLSGQRRRVAGLAHGAFVFARGRGTLRVWHRPAFRRYPSHKPAADQDFAGHAFHPGAREDLWRAGDPDIAIARRLLAGRRPRDGRGHAVIRGWRRVAI